MNEPIILIDNATLITLVTILTSTLVTVISNVYSLRIRKVEIKTQSMQKQFDLYYTEKSNTFKEFVSVSSSLVLNINDGDIFDKVLSATHKAMLMCNEENKTLLKDFAEFVDARLFSGTKPTIEWRTSYWNKLSEVTLSLNNELDSTSDLISPKRRKCTKSQ